MGRAVNVLLNRKDKAVVEQMKATNPVLKP